MERIKSMASLVDDGVVLELGRASWDTGQLSVGVRYRNANGGFRHTSPELALAELPGLVALVAAAAAEGLLP